MPTLEQLFKNREVSKSVENIQIILGISGMISEENVEIEYKQDEKETWLKTVVPCLQIMDLCHKGNN